MKRKSTDYSGADSGGWMNMCDDIFLARFRGRPCAICGATHGVYASRKTRSMGHHLLSKELHRIHRFNPDNIIVLCPKHHLGADMSPHSHDGAAVKAFYDWLNSKRPEQAAFMDAHRFDQFKKDWCYRDMYVELGGEVHSTTGLKKDLRPRNHSKNVKAFEA